jgi:hypothetical protein
VINRNENVYSLEIDSINLAVFGMGIAILYYKLKYHGKPDDKDIIPVQDILNINEYGRRVFFSFIPDYSPRCPLNADSLEIVGLKGEPDMEETFKTLENDYAHNINYISKTFMDILGEGFFCTGKNPEDYTADDNGEINVIPVTDDRMFVMCYYRNNIVKELTTYREDDGCYTYELPYKTAEVNNLTVFTALTGTRDSVRGENKANINAENIDLLYRYIFFDTNWSTCPNINMRKDQIMKHVYERWADYANLYTVSEYSFVELVSEDLKDSPEYLRDHFNTMYFKIVLLCLAQRGSLIELSNKATKLSKIINKRGAFKDISFLQEEYIRFLNQIYYEHVTGQQQGIELYDFIREKFYIKDNIKELENQLIKLHEHANLKSNNKLNRRLLFIAIFCIAITILQIIGSYDVIRKFFSNLFGI